MRFPTREQCLRWYKELGTPQNIIDHVIAVNKVAVFLCKKLKEKGIEIDSETVDKGSLLHDLDKWLCINDKSVKHGFRTEEILAEKGDSELGFYAKQHRGDFIKSLKTWEEKIIYYADKRVLHDKIVSLKGRYDYINRKYPARDSENRKEDIALVYKLEKEIFDIIGEAPEILSGNVEK